MIVVGTLVIGLGVGLIVGWLMGSHDQDKRWQARLHDMARKLREYGDGPGL